MYHFTRMTGRLSIKSPKTQGNDPIAVLFDSLSPTGSAASSVSGSKFQLALSIPTLDNPMTETWKPIPDFPGYEVSDHGRVRSYKKPGTTIIADTPQRILKPSTDPGGYKRVLLRRDDATYCRSVGQLVLLAFIGCRPDGMEMCHNDSNPANDHLSNLRYDTHFNNMQDRFALPYDVATNRLPTSPENTCNRCKGRTDWRGHICINCWIREHVGSFAAEVAKLQRTHPHPAPVTART